MADTEESRPAGTGATGTEAAAELAEIRRRQERVIKGRARTVLVLVG